MSKPKVSVSLAVMVLSLFLAVSVANSVFAENGKVKKESGNYRCTDGIDNDLDGLIDACDPDCTKNRNERKLLKWAACLDDDPMPPSDDEIPPVIDDDPVPSEPEPYVWTPEGNLLNNPSADQGLYGWFSPYWNRYNYEVNDVVLIDNDPAFYLFEDETRFSEYYLVNGANLSQDVKLPPDSSGKYLVMAGFVMTEGEEGVHPWPNTHFWSYFMDETNFIEYPIRRLDSTAYACGSGCWHPEFGIFAIPEGIANIRLFMDIYWNDGDDPAGVTGYYDDLEMRVFYTQEEAEAFVDAYILAHPQGIR